MAKIAFVSICDRNAHGLRMMSSSLLCNGYRVVNALHRRALRLRGLGRSRTADVSAPSNPAVALAEADVQAKAALQDVFQIQ